MPKVNLEIGLDFWIDDDPHRIDSFTKEGKYSVSNALTGISRVMSRSEIFQGIVDGRIVMPLPLEAVPAQRRTSIRQNLKRDLQGLSDAERKELRRRWKYVADHVKGVFFIDRKEVMSAIAKKAIELTDSHPPSYQTFRRWIRLLIAADYDIRALIPCRRQKGYLTRNVPEESRVLAQSIIRKFYMTRARLSVNKTFAHFTKAVSTENRKPGRTARFVRPSRRWFYREVARMNQYEILEAREGKRVADYHYKDWNQSKQPTRPYERIEIDHTRLDLFVVDEEPRLPIGRPWLTLAVDTFSRMIVGFHLGFDPPSWHSVAACLQHLILPKEAALSAYPGIKCEWPCNGVPETIVCDNGKEFHSDNFIEACQQLNIQIQYNPVRSPWMKGVVESSMGSVNKQLLNGLPGFTISKFTDRSDYDPQKNAVIGMPALVEIIYKWIVDDFCQQFKEGTMAVPFDKWMAGAERFEPALPTSVEDVQFALSNTVVRTIQRQGIRFLGLHYQSKALKAIDIAIPGRVSVALKIDRSNLGEITVIDPRDGTRIPVPCTNQAYANNRTLWQHAVVRRFKRRSRDPEIQLMSWAEVQDYITKIALDEWRKSYEKRGRHVIARFLGIDSSAPTGKIDRQFAAKAAETASPPATPEQHALVKKILDEPELEKEEVKQREEDDEDDGLGYKAVNPAGQPFRQKPGQNAAPSADGDDDDD